MAVFIIAYDILLVNVVGSWSVCDILQTAFVSGMQYETLN